MFASRLTNQCHRYFSWQPDPCAEATDAFQQDWSQLRGFANPPWNQIPRVLTKNQTQGVNVTLVAPVWKAQPWYALLLSMLVDWPRPLPQQSISPHLDINPQLAVWSISGNASAVKAFQVKLQNWSCSHGGPRRINLTTHSSGNGVVGVLNGVQIHFQDL